jgi:hypothetical protein
MTQPLGRTGKAQTTGPRGGDTSIDPTKIAAVRRLSAVERVAADLLSRVDKILREDPAAIADRYGTMLPRELEDRQAYFLEQAASAQRMLNELASLLPRDLVGSSPRDQIGVELMLLFVLIECFRPERLQESGWAPDLEVQDAIREKLDRLALVVVNMRQRLK